MLVESSWLPQAKRLVEGTKQYNNHTCGSGKTLVVSANEAGWGAHCFRCNENGFVPYGLRIMADLSVIRKKEVMYEKESTCVLPEDFTLEIPPEYSTWLSRNSIFTSTARMYGVGYSEQLKRIILPIYEGNSLIFQQARAVEVWRKPKYLNQGNVPKSSVLFKSSLEGLPFDNSMRVCCITEDIASCMRVGMYIPAVCALGTSLSDAQAEQIAVQYDYVLHWYDSDQAGINGTIKGQRVLRMLGLKCYSVCTSKDPKQYTNQEIVQVLTKGVISGRYRPDYPQNYEGKRIIRENVPELTIRMFR